MIIVIRFEIKKTFDKPVSRISLLLLVVVFVWVCCSAIGNIRYVDSEGNVSTGLVAAKLLRNEKKQWSGYLTEKTLQKVLEENEKINNSKENLSKDTNENEKAYARKQGFSDITRMISQAFSKFQEYDSLRVDSISQQEVGNFYDKRIDSLEEWLNTEMSTFFSDAEKQFLMKQYKNMEKPLYYEYEDGWSTFFSNSTNLIRVLLLIMGFWISGIFSDEFKYKADAIFFSTKLGRTKGTRAKIYASILMITVIYWGTMFLFSAIIFGLLGFDGGDCMIQTLSFGWNSFYNITNLQLYILIIFGGYLGCIFVLTFSMLVSAKTHSSVLAVTIPFIILCIPLFLSDVSVLSNILALLPDQLLQIRRSVRNFDLYQIGGKIIGAVPVVFILYLILYSIILPVLYYVYSKTELK